MLTTLCRHQHPHSRQRPSRPVQRSRYSRRGEYPVMLNRPAKSLTDVDVRVSSVPTRATRSTSAVLRTRRRSTRTGSSGALVPSVTTVSISPSVLSRRTAADPRILRLFPTVIVEALLQGYKDGNDILTLSLGGSDGWTESSSSVVSSRIAAAGRIVTIAAGKSRFEDQMLQDLELLTNATL